VTAVGLAAWLLELALLQAADAQLGTRVVPGTVVGKVGFVPGKFGLAAALEPQTVQGKATGGITYPCTADTFCAEHGTFACWFKGSAFPCVLLLQESAANYQLGVWWAKEGGPYFPFVFVYNKPPEAYDGLIRAQVVPDFWCHLALTWDCATRLTRLFINGQEGPGSPRRFGLFPVQAGDTLRLGAGYLADRDEYQGIFRGLLDEVVVLDRALGTEEAQALYFAGKFSPDEHTRLYVSFDDDSSDGVSAAPAQPAPAAKPTR
jgi:hypothetical protein